MAKKSDAREELRFVATGDVHLSNALPYSKPGLDGVTDRLNDQVALLAAMAEDAEEYAAHGAILAGDIFDKAVLDGPTASAGMRALSAYPCPVALGPGNHEAASPRGGRFLTSFFSVIGHAVGQGVGWIGGEGPSPIFAHLLPEWLKLWWVDYCPPDEAARRIALTREATRDADVSLLFLHHAVKGCTDGGWLCDDGLEPSTLCEGFRGVISGHFHDSQTFGTCGWYMGAPMQHDFGDAGKKRGWWRISVDDRARKGDGGIYFEFRESQAPRFHVVRFHGGDLDFDYPTPAAPVFADVQHDDYLRIVVETTHARWATHETPMREWADRLRAARALRLVDVVHEPVYHVDAAEARLGEGAESADLRDLVARYVDIANTEGLDKERLVEAGRQFLEDGGA